MKASELINELISVVNHHGDIEVVVEVDFPEQENDYDLQEVTHSEKCIWLHAGH